MEKSAGAVIFSDSYLLLHYKAGHWGFVKGHRESGESIKQTVIRETKEETGIEDLQFLNGFKEKINYFFKRSGETVHKDVVYLLAKTKTKQIKLSKEHQDFKWLSYEEARKQLTHENAKKILEKAEKQLTQE